MILNCRGELHEFRIPIVMGILNLTEDSFYDGGRYISENEILTQITKMAGDGAEIIDLGAISTRPGSTMQTAEQEIEKLIPVIKLVKKKFPELLISVDTFRSDVLAKAYEVGADIHNDISGGSWDSKLLDLLAHLKMPYILMHIKGSFSSMHNQD